MSKAFLMGLNAGRVEDGEDEFDIKELAKHIDGSSTEFVIDGSWGITEIKPYCFYNSLLEGVNLTPITKIGDYAFYNGSELTDFVFNPNILKEVGAYAFYDCKKAFLGKEGNISFEVNLETVGNYAFHNFALNGKVFDIDFKKKCNFGDYAFRYAKIKKLKGSLGDVGQYAFENLGSAIEEIDVKIEGSVANYAFQNNNNAMFKIDKDSDITALGTYAFQNFGANRSNPSSNRITLNFRNSSFVSIGTYAFAGSSSSVSNKPKYYDIFFSDKLESISTYAFTYGENFNLYFNSVPTLSNSNAFSNTSNYKIFVDYKSVGKTQEATNWSDIKSNIYGYAKSEDLDELITHDIYSGKSLTWYKDADLTEVITTVDKTVDFNYAEITGVSRETYYLEFDITKADVEIKNNDTNEIYTKSALVHVGDSLEITKAEPIGEAVIYALRLNGVETSIGHTFTMDEDYAIRVFAFEGTINFDFATADPIEIQNASLNGLADNYQLGATKNIELTSGVNITLRIADNTGNIVKREDGSYAGLIIEFANQWTTTSQMNTTNTNIGGWRDSLMRNTTMGTLFDLLPLEWQDIIATTQVQSTQGRSGNPTVTLDKLWLPAEREIFATRSYSPTVEWNALTRFALYALPANDNNAFRSKQRAGSNQPWLLRSTCYSDSYQFMAVYIGSADCSYADNSRGVAPCFTI